MPNARGQDLNSSGFDITSHRYYPAPILKLPIFKYDTNGILAYAVSAGMEAEIPPKKNRKEQREYDKYLYKLRHLAENCFLVLKRWRGIAARCAKTSDAFIAAVRIRCIAIWAAIHA